MRRAQRGQRASRQHFLRWLAAVGLLILSPLLPESAKESQWSRGSYYALCNSIWLYTQIFLSLALLHLLGQWTKGMSSLCVLLQSDPQNLSSSGGSTCYPWTFRLAARHVVRPALPLRRLSTTSPRRTLSRSRHCGRRLFTIPLLRETKPHKKCAHPLVVVSGDLIYFNRTREHTTPTWNPTRLDKEYNSDTQFLSLRNRGFLLQFHPLRVWRESIFFTSCVTNLVSD
jgi:hypothetical protein